jgi:apolipoprotein N-acyltransferase
MPTERPWPSSPRFRNVGIVATFAVSTAFFLWLGMRLEQPVVAALPFFVAVPIGWYLFWPRRCPQCGGRLRTRDDAIEGTTEYRILAVCPRCEVDWDTGMKGDSRYVD